MKAIIALLIISISGTIYSQDYDTLKKSDTIYVLFKGKKNERKSIAPQPKYNYDDRWYYFFGLEQTVALFHFKYHSYENKVANIVSDVTTVDDNFIKKNKAKIITPRFLKKNNLCKVVADILNHNRTIYIIDCTEKKDGKIVLYEVQMSTICRGDG
nr:hypothetical protein [uncultured Flavobacterium sp.]